MLIILLFIVSIALFTVAFGAILLTFKNQIKFFSGVITTTAALVFSSIVSIFRSNLATGTDTVNAIINETFARAKETILAMQLEQLQRFFANVSNENISIVRESIFSTLDMIKGIYTIMFPSILILNTLLISYVIYMMTKQVLGLLKKDIYRYPKFSQLKLSRSMSAMLIVSFILPLFISSPVANAAITNIIVIISGIAVACGMSFIDFKLRKKIRSAWFRLLIYISVVFLISFGVGPLITVLIFIAIADSYFDFRKVPKQEVKKNG